MLAQVEHRQRVEVLQALQLPAVLVHHLALRLAQSQHRAVVVVVQQLAVDK
jgi:hypothetical protein